MIESQPGSAGRMARWLLLASTVFGLAMMHTLGHAGMSMTGHPARAGVATAQAGMMRTPADHRPESAAVRAESDCPGCPGEHGMAGWTICLAVLSGLAVLVLLAAMLLVRRDRAPRARGARGRWWAGSRAPPAMVGLMVVSTTVLRV